MSLKEINQLPESEARARFLACCHCRSWAAALAAGRPFDSLEALLTEAETLWARCGEAEWLEAFSGHAKIGDIDALKKKFATTTRAEQGQVLDADVAVLEELRQRNIDYENKYGFIFIVCATGKSAEEMLQLLKARMQRSRAQELQQAAREQGEITRLRLIKLWQQHP